MLAGIVIAILGVLAGCHGSPSPSPSRTPRELGRAGLRVARRRHAGLFSRPSRPQYDTIVASQRRAWIVGLDGSQPRQIDCCSPAERIVTGSVDLSGKGWLILSDGTPVATSGYRPPIAKAIKALNQKITDPNTKTARQRAVIGWSVAMLDENTAVVATRSLGRGVNESPAHSDDVMIWKVRTGKKPTLLAGVPSGHLRFFWAPGSLYDRSGVDPLDVELDTIQAIVPLSASEFALAIWAPYGPNDGYLTIGLLSPRNLRQLTSTGSHDPRLEQMVRQSDTTVNYSWRTADQGAESRAVGLWGGSRTISFDDGPSFIDPSGNQVQATTVGSKVTVTWTDR